VGGREHDPPLLWSADAGSGPSSRVARRLRRHLGFPRLTRRAISPARSRCSSARPAAPSVIDAQYVGIFPDSAKRARRLPTAARGRQADAGRHRDRRPASSRTRPMAGHQLYPAHPGRPGATQSAGARRVLENSRIELPAASAADVRSGQVHDTVLTALLVLSRQYRIGPIVVRSGHRKCVCSAQRGSVTIHAAGRSTPAESMSMLWSDKAAPKSLVVEYMLAAAAAGPYNVGGPHQLSPSASRFFSDATHHDHVHAGFLS
jgi:hypothetical protein